MNAVNRRLRVSDRCRRGLVAWVLLFLASAQAGRAQIAYVYLDSLRQVIQGFGAANIRPWRPDMTADDIRAAFGTGEGEIGLTILRLRVPSDPAEFALNLPSARAAYAMGVKIIASPWSPPARLKTNGSIVGGRLKPECYGDYAQHLKSFADFMAQNGAPLYAISIQNEPDVQVTYESCSWSPEEMVQFLREHGGSVGVRLIAPESYHFDKTYSDAILQDSLAAKHLDIVGGHIYGGGLEPYPLAERIGKEIWMTEHLDLDTTWSGVLNTAKEISDCMRAGMSAYVWWYIVRYYGPILEGGTGRVSKRGYVMAQFSRFIRPGFVRVATTYTPQRWVYVTAYKHPSEEDRVVIVAINQSPYSRQQTFVLRNASVTSFATFVTSKEKNCERGPGIDVADSSFTFTLPPSSITTFVSGLTSALAEGSARGPADFELSECYPNPCNSLAKITYRLDRPAFVSLKVYDVQGREVLTLYEGLRDLGTHAATLDASRLPSGVYFCRLSLSGRSVSKKFLVVK